MKSSIVYSCQTIPAESSPLASALGLIQSSDQLRSGYGALDIGRISSTWLPASYLPLGGFDEAKYLESAEIQKTLQKIIYRLCSLALTCRSDVIEGQPPLAIAHLDQLLSLGFEDMDLGREDRDARTGSSIYSAMGPKNGAKKNGARLMEQYLLKIYEMLKTAHRMTVTMKPGELERPFNHTVVYLNANTIVRCIEQ